MIDIDTQAIYGLAASDIPAENPAGLADLGIARHKGLWFVLKKFRVKEDIAAAIALGNDHVRSKLDIHLARCQTRLLPGFPEGGGDVCQIFVAY